MRYINIILNMVYLSYFLILGGVFDPIDKEKFIVFAILGVLFKVLFLKFCFEKEQYKLCFLNKRIQIFICLVFLLLLLKNLNYLIFNFGLINVIIYCLIYLLGYFIGIKKCIINNTNGSPDGSEIP